VLLIDTAGNAEVALVVSVAGAVVTFSQSLAVAHSSGAAVAVAVIPADPGEHAAAIVRSPYLAGADMAGAPVLMLALVSLPLQDQSESLPPVQPGQAFWTDPDNVPPLVAAGQASPPPPGTPYPRPLLYTVRGWPGLSAATANSSP
jgi:hypothetical protein